MFESRNALGLYRGLPQCAGKAARTFTLDYGMKQFIDFPTHSKGNILDLIISDLWLEAVPLPHLGSSDHINILCTVKVDTAMPEPPPGRRVYDWKTAPWDRIRGGIRADLRSWKASGFKTGPPDLTSSVPWLPPLVSCHTFRYIAAAAVAEAADHCGGIPLGGAGLCGECTSEHQR